MPDPVLVRVAPEILAELEAEESPPVVFVSAQKQDDGTYELVFQRSARVAELEASLLQAHDILRDHLQHDDDLTTEGRAVIENALKGTDLEKD